MNEEDRKNITYQRQRYRSKEKELEITPDTETPGKAIVVANIGESRSKEEATFHNLLKALNDLAQGQKEMLEELKQKNRDKSIHHEFLFRDISGASQQYDHPSPTR